MLTRRRALRGIRIDAEPRMASSTRRTPCGSGSDDRRRRRVDVHHCERGRDGSDSGPVFGPDLNPTPWRARRRERGRGGHPEGVWPGGGETRSGVGGSNPWTRRMCARRGRRPRRGRPGTDRRDRRELVGFARRGVGLGVGASVVDVVDEREAPWGALVGDAAGERADEGAPVATGAHQAVQDERQGSFRRAGGSGRGLDHLERQRRRLVRRREASAPGDTIEGAEGRPTPRPRRAPLLRGADAPRRHRTIDRARQGAHRPRIARERARARGYGTMGGVPGTPHPSAGTKSRDERAERRLRVRAGCASSYVGRARRGVDDDGSIATRLLHHARTTPAGGSSSRASDSRISRASAHFRVTCAPPSSG